MNSTIMQVQTLVSQGLEVVTASINSVPVIPIYMPDRDKEILAVNFLRCGCPAVQVIRNVEPIDSDFYQHEQGDQAPFQKRAKVIAKYYEHALLILAQAGEEFYVFANGSLFPDERAGCQTWVFEFRRLTKHMGVGPVGAPLGSELQRMLRLPYNPEVLLTTLHDFALSIEKRKGKSRTRNTLINSCYDVARVYDLVQKSEAEICRRKGIAARGNVFREIEQALAELNLKFGMKFPEEVQEWCGAAIKAAPK